jgi:hypothetical protein
MELWTETLFQDKVSKAIDHLRLILQAERRLKPAADVPHKYDDKFALAETLTNTTIAAAFRILKFLGQHDPNVVDRMRQWADSGSGQG